MSQKSDTPEKPSTKDKLTPSYAVYVYGLASSYVEYFYAEQQAVDFCSILDKHGDCTYKGPIKLEENQK
jgi:hypothetical protein